MKSHRVFIKILLALLFTAALIAAGQGCKKTEIDSAWLSRSIEIDGVRGSDWDGVMYKINDLPVAVGFQNDADYIYCMLTTYDQSVQHRIFSGGLTIWFDSSGGGDQIFGIHFPLAPGKKELSERPELKDVNIAEEGFRFEQMPFDMTDMEITRPSEKRKERVNINQIRGIQAKIVIAEGNLTYELKVPLKVTGPDRNYVGTEAGATISIGIETAEEFKDYASEFERRRPDAEQLPPGLRDDGSGRGEIGPNYGAGDNKVISFWANVRLASRKP